MHSISNMIESNNFAILEAWNVMMSHSICKSPVWPSSLDTQWNDNSLVGHMESYFTKEVDKVRADEHWDYKAKNGTSHLIKTRYMLLRSKESKLGQTIKDFAALSRVNLKIAKEWSIKENSAGLWNFIGQKQSLEELTSSYDGSLVLGLDQWLM